MENWVPFWIDTVFGYGWIKSKEEWVEFVNKKHEGKAEKLLGLSQDIYVKERLAFGEGVRFQGALTLGEWAKENQMDLVIHKKGE